MRRTESEPRPVAAGVRLESWSPTFARERLDDVMAVYRAAFLDVFESDPARAAAERRAHVGAHLLRPDVTVLAAVDDADRLLGVTYSVPGKCGIWWHDVVAAALPAEVAADWMSDVLEVVELHVRPEAQGTGTGRALLRALLAATDARTAMLSALDDPTLPARHLYAAEGFTPLLVGFRFPGSQTRYAVLGRRLR